MLAAADLINTVRFAYNDILSFRGNPITLPIHPLVSKQAKPEKGATEPLELEVPENGPHHQRVNPRQ
jgi:hypothetical protein